MAPPYLFCNPLMHYKSQYLNVLYNETMRSTSLIGQFKNLGYAFLASIINALCLTGISIVFDWLDSFVYYDSGSYDGVWLWIWTLALVGIFAAIYCTLFIGLPMLLARRNIQTAGIIIAYQLAIYLLVAIVATVVLRTQYW